MGRRKKFTREQVIEAINQWLIERGVPPTIEELRKRLRVGSTRTVFRYLQWLEESGDIERWAGARGLRLRKKPGGASTQLIPIVGEAPAGPLMIAEENRESWVGLPQTFLRPPSAKFFLLRVRGDSMNKARVYGQRIENGDLVLVRQQATAEPRAIVVALIDGEATIKRLMKGPGYYFLKPESSNAAHQPIIMDREFRIQGEVCRVIKAGGSLLSPERNS